MVQFQTPQFIERDPKVIGPFTFKHAAYLGVPIAIIFVLWFVIASEHLILFILLAVLLEGTGVVLAFVKLEGKSIPEVLMNALFFVVRPKTYVWKRGDTALNLKAEESLGQDTEGKKIPHDRLVKKSRVADLSVKVQTKK